jgi:two-component system, LuxR family, sensor kinase FixL
MVPFLHLVVRLLLVAIGYYIGAWVGFALKFPEATPSVMWPPNAVLTTALLLTSPKRWWMYLLAALPVHLAIELPVFPPALALGLFITNCSEAVLGAGLVHWLSDQPGRFDTLRRTAVFVACAGVAAPLLSSFPDAALVSAVRGESFWSIVSTRFPSNVLAELTITPTLATIALASRRGLRGVSFRRLGEAALLVCGLLVVGVVAFGGPPGGSVGRLWLLHTPFALLLPFLLWAAVRFGPGGLSLCLLTTVMLAIHAGMREVGMFTTLPHREDGVLALQLFLTVLGIPLLCMSSLMEEGRRTSQALEERLRFEAMLARLSNAFVHVPSSEMDRAFQTWLKRIGEELRLDCLALLEFAPGGEEFIVRYWSTTGQDTEPRTFRTVDFPWAVARLHREELVTFTDPDDLPGIADGERAFLRRHGVGSGAIVPLEAGGRVLGGLAFVTLAETRVGPDRLAGRLSLVGEVFANALARRETEDALRASEGMKSAILAALGSGVAVLDRDGTIIAVNEHWTKRAEEVGTSSASRAGVGDNYLAAWRKASAEAAYGRDALAGIQAVLDRRREAFALAYPCSGALAGRWFELSAVPLHRAAGGAVIASREITDWKRAEVEAQRSREELAHFTRVSAMGALAASLAHELNQPLTGILSNAQAARRFLQVVPPDLAELHAILTDIIEDDKRAGEVIERLRELLRKGDSHASALDLNALVRDVARLLHSDALIRNVRIQLVLAARSPTVVGDRIQLQQVMLNLLVNAMDAMAGCEQERRVVTVETATSEDGVARVSVRDAGVGIESGMMDRIFEPFYTTKPQGMGMGLSITRSIVEAHGGRIWALNNPNGGATFGFTVPLAGVGVS